MSRWHTTEFDLLPQAAFRPRGGKYTSMTLEGGGKGGGSSAPPPDPRLIQAQIESMGIQGDAIKQIMANANRLMPLQEAQMKFGLDTARQSYDQAQEDRQFALGRRGLLSGLQDQITSQASNFNEETRRGELMGRATADAQQSFDSVRGQQERSFARRGINPNSGAALAMDNQSRMAQATAMAGVSAKISEAARQEGIALKSNAANMLSGFPAMASSNTGQSFGFGTAGLGLANQGLAGMNSGYGQGAGIGAQMGSNAAGMYGAMGNYKNGQDQIAASNDPFNTILGAASGVGTKWALGKL